MTSAPVRESSLPVGRPRGSPAARPRAPARSRPAAARRPRDATAGASRDRRGRPRRAVHACARAARPSTPVGASFASTFSAAVSVGMRLNCRRTKPNERRRSSASAPSARVARSRPSKTTLPLDGRSWSSCAFRVTVRSVPMPDSGSSAFFCASSRPFAGPCAAGRGRGPPRSPPCHASAVSSAPADSRAGGAPRGSAARSTRAETRTPGCRSGSRRA